MWFTVSHVERPGVCRLAPGTVPDVQQDWAGRRSLLAAVGQGWLSSFARLSLSTEPEAGGQGPGAGADLPQPQGTLPAIAVPTRERSQSERLKSTGDAPCPSCSWLSRVRSDKDRARAAGRTDTHVADMGYRCRQSYHPRCVHARLLDHRACCARLKGPGLMRIFYF